MIQQVQAVKTFTATLLVTVFSISTVYAAGYEKTVMFSGRQGGMAGMGATGVSGAESLFFNPSGLASPKYNLLDATVNVSPTYGNFSAPIVIHEQSLASKQTFSPVYGAFAAYKVTDKLGVGVGTYVGAGASSLYENIDYSAAGKGFTTLTPTQKTSLTIQEYAIGAAYEVIPKLKIGVAWRILQVSGSYSSSSYNNVPSIGAGSALIGGFATGGAILQEVSFTNLKQTKYDGYKIGASYDEEHWGLGATFRSQSNFSVNGDLSGRVQLSDNSGAVGSGMNDGTIYNLTSVAGGTLSSALPMQLTIGGYADVKSDLRVFGEYQFTQYSIAQQLDLTGQLQGTLTPIGSLSAGQAAAFPALVPLSNKRNVNTDLATTPVAQYWADQHIIRVASEYTGIESTALRAGYAYTSRVTSVAYARPTFASPGDAHTLTIGAGRQITDGLGLNLGLEYAFGSGRVKDGENASDISTKTGPYSSSAFAIHTGINYRL